MICKPIGVWTPVDAKRKAQRTLKAQIRNFETNNTTKPPKMIEEQVDCIFDYAPYTVNHLPVRGHTGYIIVAVKPVQSESQTAPSLPLLESSQDSV